MQAIILAGGLGSRLQSVVKNTPKPMALVDNRPFLFYLLSYLMQHGFINVVISVGYLKEYIQNIIGDNFLGLNIKYAVEDTPLGTGGAIINALQYIDHNQPIIILNGDTFLQINYAKFIKHYKNNNTPLAIALKQINNSQRYGTVQFDKHNIITEFIEKDLNRKEGFINSGVYIANSNIFTDYHLSKKFSFESDFLAKYTHQLKISAFVTKDYFIDIGIPSDYKIAQQEIPKKVKNKALFLDRDGVINIDYGHVHTKEKFHFIDGIFDLCRQAQIKGFLIIIVTNQAGIAKGFYTEEEFLELTKWMELQFKQQNTHIAKTYYCPYHIEGSIEKYKKESEYRKPNPGMILTAIQDFNIDPKKSILIGDKESDIIAAQKANIKTTILFDQKKHSFSQILSE